MNFDIIPSDETINNAKAALEKNGIAVYIAENAEAAKQKALEIIPKGAEVMTMTSQTVDAVGLSAVLNESGNYNSVRNALYGNERTLTPREKKKLGGAPEYVTGSVHAITENGEVIIVSNTGSQLGAYSYGADHVLWIAGAQKLVKNMDEGMKRIYDYVLPLESERAKRAYGVPGSNVSKLLIVNKEITPERTIMILVKEVLGF